MTRVVCDNERCKWFGLPRSIGRRAAGRGVYCHCQLVCECGHLVREETS